MSIETKNHMPVFKSCLVGAAILLGGAVAANAADKGKWGYDFENGPAHWAELDQKFETCGTGQAQSPIDIPAETGSGAPRIAFNYVSGPATVINNGHTIEAKVAKGSTVEIDGRTYDLIQFHFHTPSENTVDGLHYPMETHFVHADKSGKLAVVSVMVKAGTKSLIDALPKPEKAGLMVQTESEIDPVSLIPSDRRHYAFKGSLTTPPCSENVTWVVMKRPATADVATIARMKAILGANNRPVNPLNGRLISSAH